MSKIAVIGTIEVQQGARAEVLQAVLTHRERCLKDEGTPEQLAKYIDEDRKTWQGVLDKLNIKPE